VNLTTNLGAKHATKGGKSLGNVLRGKSSKDEVSRAVIDLKNAFEELSEKSSNHQLKEIKSLSSDLVHLKNSKVLNDDEFTKLITFVFSYYINTRVDTLINEKLEQKLTNIFWFGRNDQAHY